MQGGQIDRLFMIYKNNSLKERRTDMAAISIDGTPMTALPSDADQINYDNSNSRLSDTQVQDAIDTLANDSSTFVGTTTQWDNLTTAQKKAYKYRLLTDDYTDASIGNLNALMTTDKSSVVGAINEVKSGLTGLITRTISEITTDQFKHVVVGSVNKLLQVSFYNQSGYNINYTLYTYLDNVMAELPEASTIYTMCKFEYNS